MSKLVEWYDMEGGDPIGAYEWGEGEDPICPYCEKEAHYWEGTVGQDEMGNDEEAYHWMCFDDSHDMICTDLIYLG